MPRGRKKGCKNPNKFKGVVMPPRETDPRSIPGEFTDAKIVKCKCPRCEKIYKRLIYWMGNGMPRMYCPPCLEIIRETQIPEVVSMSDPKFLRRIDRISLDSDWNP